MRCFSSKAQVYNNPGMKPMKMTRRSHPLSFYALICILPWTVLLMLRDPLVTWQREQSENHVAELTTRLQHVMSQLDESRSDVHVMAQHLVRLVQQPRRSRLRNKVRLRDNTTSLPSWSLLSLHTRRLVQQLSGIADPSLGDERGAYQPLVLPSAYTFLPHLLETRDMSLRPSVHLYTPRDLVSLVIGIASVRRGDLQLLVDTLNSLLYSMAKDEERMTLIIISIAETDISYAMELAHEIRSRFPSQLHSGLLEVISPPASFFPSTAEFGEARQALELAFLMAHAIPRGALYLQLGDAVVTRRYGFVSNIVNAASQRHRSKPWLLLDFGPPGLIGKVIRTRDLPRLVQLFVMFYETKPADWLLDCLVSTVACAPYMNATACTAAKQDISLQLEVMFRSIGNSN